MPLVPTVKNVDENIFIKTANLVMMTVSFILLATVGTAMFLVYSALWFDRQTVTTSDSNLPDPNRWKAPDVRSIPTDERGDLVRYGRELILHTDKYFGPRGKVNPMANGMVCTNCHLDGGTKYFGNNFSAVASTYPKYRPRYGGVESMSTRINDCITRSLNGKAIDEQSLEMRAMVAYMVWLGQDVKKGESPVGVGLKPIEFLDRAADYKRGGHLYLQKCAVCHGMSGEGLKNKDGSWLNPPVWGNQSYTVGAGMYRIGRLAFFIKSNMPWGADAEAPKLTDEEAWDIAAYINSGPRPQADLSKDWPEISTKPFDYPFGPYSDKFSEERHKYGPYQEIIKSQTPGTTRVKIRI